MTADKTSIAPTIPASQMTDTTPVKHITRFPKSAQMGYNQLYLDFLKGVPQAGGLYPDTSAESVAKLVHAKQYNRAALAKILKRQNELFGAKSRAMQNIEALKQPDSLVVFAGQQAGLFGGPLLGFYKAIWAVKQAAELSERLKCPVIPIFWVAADDHDFAEINHTYTFDVIGEPVQRSYYRVENEGRPAYDLRFTDEELFAELRESLTDSLGRTDFTDDLYERLFSAYKPGADFVTAFGQFFLDTMPDNGLLLFSPGDDEFKALAEPFFQLTLENHAELKRALRESNERIRDAGYHLQVQKEESACHLFLLDPERKAIHRDGDRYRVGDKTYSGTELRELIKAEPSRFSPDVLTRPAFAACLFPTIEQGGGPSEVAYFAQLWRMFDIYNTPAPCFSGRISVTLIEKRFEKLLKKHDLTFLDFCGDIEQVINEALGKTFPHDLEESFENLRKNIEVEFTGVSQRVVAFDKSLEANAGQILGKMEHAITTFEKKVFASHKRKLGDERAALYRAGNSLFPRHGLQERTLSVVYYLSRYGYKLMDFICDSVELDTTHHQLLYISEMDK